MAQYVIHAFESINPDEKTIDFRMADYQFRIPPFEPFEIDVDSNGRKVEHADFFHYKILEEYGPLFGIINLPLTRTKSGIMFDVEGGIEAAKKQLHRNRLVRINEWVQDQMQNRVRQNLPVLAPTGFVADSLILLKVNVSKKYKLHPVGWDEGEQFGLVDDAIGHQSVPVLKVDPEADRKLAEMAADNELLREELAGVQANFASLQGQMAEILAELKKKK